MLCRRRLSSSFSRVLVERNHSFDATLTALPCPLRLYRDCVRRRVGKWLMNPEMNLLYLKSTGHVLAAFTRSGEPDKAETTADAFVGAGLHLRAFGSPSKYAPPHIIA